MLCNSCGGICDHKTNGKGFQGWICRNCGSIYDGPYSPPEKKESKTKSTLPIRIAQIILRDDNGPTDQRSSPEQFIEFRPGKFIDLKFLDTVPAYHVGQLDFCDE